jgi:hypothetical protein
MPLRTNKEIREELKGTSFLSLLDLYRQDKYLTEHQKQELWLGVSDWVSSLARKHYGQNQRTGHYVKGVPRQWYEPVKGNFKEFDKHRLRMEFAYSFVKESSPDVPIRGVVFSFNRRFVWTEMLVELTVLGVQFLPDKTTTQRINSTILRDLILGNSLARQFKDTHGRYPNYDEITIEFSRHLLSMGKKINLRSCQRFLNRWHNYQQSKSQADPLVGYDEQRGGALLSDNFI